MDKHKLTNKFNTESVVIHWILQANYEFKWQLTLVRNQNWDHKKFSKKTTSGHNGRYAHCDHL